MTKKVTGPSKNDLLTILRQHECYEHPKVTEANQQHKEAQKVLSAFLQNCKRYRQLKQQVEATRRRAYRLAETHRRNAKQDRVDCFNAVRLYGVTPAVIKKIEQFLRRHSG